VTTEGFEPAELPEKFEAGTPPITEAIGLAAAIDYVEAVGLERIQRYEQQLTARAHAGLAEVPGLRLLGPAPEHKAGIISFVIDGVHAHDVAHALDRHGVAVRAGHHCAMPLHERLGVTASSRASFYFYNTPEEVDALVAAVGDAQQRFAPKGRKRKRRS
jgi:cysteine desulfurase/selenocysteine lyase